MIVKNEEAKEKWCPVSRMTWADMKDDGGYMTATNGNGVGWNRVRIQGNGKNGSATGKEYSVGKCVGPECMWWIAYNASSGSCGAALRGAE